MVESLNKMFSILDWFVEMRDQKKIRTVADKYFIDITMASAQNMIDQLQ
jgi:hypothetical protein